MSGSAEIKNETEKTAEISDRRVRKTRAALKHALTILMKKKNINSISVKELTDLADINRGTFYLHYKDVFDLLSQSEDDLLDELKETVDAFPADTIKNQPEALFAELYRLCYSNSDMVRILISENGDIKFLNKLKRIMRDKCLKDWSKMIRANDLEHFDACYSFIVGGCLSLIQYWFADNMKETPEELAQITALFINQTINQ